MSSWRKPPILLTWHRSSSAAEYRARAAGRVLASQWRVRKTARSTADVATTSWPWASGRQANTAGGERETEGGSGETRDRRIQSGEMDQHWRKGGGRNTDGERE
jgi:hypothetical protein